MLFSFDVKLTDEDYFIFNEFHLKHSSVGRKMTLFSKILLSAIFLFGAAFNFINRGFNPVTITAGIFLLLCCLLSVFLFDKTNASLTRLQIKALYKKKKMPYTPDSVMEFREDSFTEISPETKAETLYCAIERVCVLRNRYVYLFIDEVRAHIIPVDCFKSTDKQTEFISFLADKGCTVEYFDKI